MCLQSPLEIQTAGLCMLLDIQVQGGQGGVGLGVGWDPTGGGRDYGYELKTSLYIIAI